jgi:hypothetical protein
MALFALEASVSIPSVQVGDWIRVGSSDALVLRVYGSGSIYVGYFQNRAKAIGEDVIWDGSAWKFKYEGPNGTYLSGADEAAVKRGPARP